MKIAITTVQAPFIKGGAELHANNLKNAFLEAGYEADIITLPFMDNPASLIPDHIVAARLLEIENIWAGKVDLCVGLKFPAYCIPHTNKIIWALHQHRAAYDLFDTEYSHLKNNAEGLNIKQIITNADNIYLKEAKRIYANSLNVAKRMKKFNNIEAKPLYHPCPDMDKFYCGESENYILMPSRITITKRQLLAVKAMKYVKSNMKLYIVGRADNPYEKERLIKEIHKSHLEHKVKLFDYVDQKTKFELYANAKAILFIPLDEDYGYITLEAMASSKAVITAEDSGGPLEFVTNGETGYVVKPEAQAIADQIDCLAAENGLAKILGKRSKDKLENMNITWEHVVKELVK